MFELPPEIGAFGWTRTTIASGFNRPLYFGATKAESLITRITGNRVRSWVAYAHVNPSRTRIGAAGGGLTREILRYVRAPNYRLLLPKLERASPVRLGANDA